MVRKAVTAYILAGAAIHAAPVTNDSYVAPYATGVGWTAAFNQARDLVQQMTLAEKLNLTVWGHGVPRLGFYGYNASDGSNGPAGTFTTNHTAYENSITLAGSLDRSLMYERAQLTGQELANKGYNVLFGPMCNMMRAPQAGRNPEGYGPEPYLTGQATALMVQGVQAAGIIAITKHFIGNEQENGRFLESSEIDDQTMHEVYEWPFADAVKAGTAGVMCSYNKINGTYACGSADVMGRQLKTALGFQGFIVSDFQAERNGPPAVNAGLDTQLGISTFAQPGQLFQDYGGYRLGSNLTTYVNNGSIPLDRINDVAIRHMTGYFLLGQNRKQFPLIPNNITTNTAETASHVRRAGAASAVLLKNNAQALPLNKPASIALFGIDADNGPGGPNQGGRGLQVAPGVFIPLGPTGANLTGTLASEWGTDYFPYLISPASAISARAAADGTRYSYTRDPYNLSAIAASASANHTTCITFASSSSGEETDAFENNFGDRANITAWFNADNVIQTVAANCRNTIVVVHAVGPILMPWADNPNITAIVFAGLPGMESGNSLVDVLYGAYNPSGKLPFTIAYQLSDYPALVDYNVTDFTPNDTSIEYSEGVLLDYRAFDARNITPRYPFMHGLSYTNFTYGNATVFRINTTASAATIAPGGPQNGFDLVYNVSASVTNSGKIAGNATPQLYIEFPSGYGQPLRVMRGFDKVSVQPGQTGRVAFPLRRKDISVWDVPSQSWVVPEGQITAYVAESSRDLRAQVVLQS